MTFKEFNDWCNRRACDGCWGIKEAIICLSIGTEVYKFPFWKRKKVWKELSIAFGIEDIVNATNQKIKEITGQNG